MYAYDRKRASATFDTLLEHATLAEHVGFEGVSVSEHHGGPPGYLPNPLQVAGWFLDATQHMWSATMPFLLPLRTAEIVAEEIAWLNARFPRRVGAAFALGAERRDFAVMGLSFDNRIATYEAGLRRVVALLRGQSTDVLSQERRARVLPR